MSADLRWLMRQVPAGHRRVLYRRQCGLCCWCGETVYPLCVSIEHIIPLSLGGTNTIDNKAIAHHRCNGARGSDMSREPHPDPLFNFVRERLGTARIKREGANNG